MTKAYYNENDKYAAEWLRNLIFFGLIADGDVDERSIEDVTPGDLAGYTQCHFFAGIGGWSYALRLAGWPDDKPVWTGSCPCQPFSAAGQGKGAADERHLWPAWFHLIAQCKPGVIFGEQVEAAINHGWLDLVQSDLEGEGYACGFVGLPAAGVGAPHIRARAWFVAESLVNTGQLRKGWDKTPPGQIAAGGILAAPSTSGELAESTYRGSEAGRGNNRDSEIERRRRANVTGCGPSGELADANGRNPSAERQQRSGEQRLLAEGSGLGELVQPRLAGLEGHTGHGDNGHEPGRLGTQPNRPTTETGATRGFWNPADWLPCRDGKARPVEPGTFPLAHGIPARVGRLRAYGNAIVPQVAAEVVRAYLEVFLTKN